MTFNWKSWLFGSLVLVGCGSPLPAGTVFEVRPERRWVEAYPYGTTSLNPGVRGGDPAGKVEVSTRGLPPGVTSAFDGDDVTFTAAALEPGAYPFTLVARRGAEVREVPLRLFAPATGSVLQEGERPVTVAVKADEGRAVTARLTPDGGTVEVVDAGGVRFVLSVPAGALTESTQIRLTPVGGVDWTGFDRALGVRLEPDTLRLWRAARVDVTFPDRPNASGVFRAFGADVGGASLFLKAVSVRELTASFVMTRAGLGGVGWVEPSALDAPPVPSLPEDRRAERLARFGTPDEARLTERTYDASLVSRLTRTGAGSLAGARTLTVLLREVALWDADLRERGWGPTFAGNVGLRWALLADAAVENAARYEASCGGPDWRAELLVWRAVAVDQPEWAGALGVEGLARIDRALAACG